MLFDFVNMTTFLQKYSQTKQKPKQHQNKAKAAHINQVKAMADAMQKKINISKEKAVMVAMLGAQEKLAQ